jgi:hypothetical protein
MKKAVIVLSVVTALTAPLAIIGADKVIQEVRANLERDITQEKADEGGSKGIKSERYKKEYREMLEDLRKKDVGSKKEKEEKKRRLYIFMIEDYKDIALRNGAGFIDVGVKADRETVELAYSKLLILMRNRIDARKEHLFWTKEVGERDEKSHQALIDNYEIIQADLDAIDKW